MQAFLKFLQTRQLNSQTVPFLEPGQIVHTGDRFPERIGHLAKANQWGSVLDIDNFTDLAAIFPAQATAPKGGGHLPFTCRFQI